MNYKHSFTVVLGMIAIGIVIGVVLTTGFNIDSKSVAGPEKGKLYTEARQSPDSEQSTAKRANFNPGSMFVDIAKSVRPSIVSIYTTKSIKVPNHPFHRFFKEWEGMPNDEGDGQSEMQQNGLGSGVIITKDGYILTNYHVVNDVDELNVKLVDNSEYEAKIVGSDPSTEIALIKIDAKDLPAAVLGNSDAVQIGEWVMAIGSPLDLTSTVTAGIVSALSRNIDIIRNKRNAPSSIENFIQTDAAINPGNSGGALVNSKGEVIGVNTAIATRTNYYMGYGFAVPINIAKSVVDDIIEFGEVRRGYLGVYIDRMSPTIAKGVKLDKPRGVFISNVMAGSAAEKAGIEEGDVILSVNGKEVNQPNELQAKIAIYNPGKEVKLVVWRYGKQFTVKAVLKGRDNESGKIEEDKKKKEEKSLPDLGMKIQDLNKRELAQLDLDYGIIVISSDQYSAAGKARIVQGDVIYELDGKPVKSVADFYDKIDDYKSGDVVRLKLRRKLDKDIFDRLVFLEIPR